MYAVIKTGGKQYKVAKDDIIKVEKLDGDKGDVVTLGDVLMMEDGNGLKVGAPLIDGGVVAAEVLEQARGDKIIVFKKKRRQNYRRTRGHRQDYTVLKITEIGGAAKAKKAAAPKTEAKAADAKADAAPKDAAAGKASAGKAETKAAAEKAEKKAPAKSAAKKDSE